jgi:hypothetical protein
MLVVPIGGSVQISPGVFGTVFAGVYGRTFIIDGLASTRAEVPL